MGLGEIRRGGEWLTRSTVRASKLCKVGKDVQSAVHHLAFSRITRFPRSSASIFFRPLTPPSLRPMDVKNTITRIHAQPLPAPLRLSSSSWIVHRSKIDSSFPCPLPHPIFPRPVFPLWIREPIPSAAKRFCPPSPRYSCASTSSSIPHCIVTSSPRILPSSFLPLTPSPPLFTLTLEGSTSAFSSIPQLPLPALHPPPSSSSLCGLVVELTTSTASNLFPGPSSTSQLVSHAEQLMAHRRADLL